MKNFIIINGRKIGEDYKPLVIPEIGINHNGSLSEAKKIVDAAHEAGAEIIKHQTHIVEDEMIPLAKNIIPNNAKESIYEIIEKCALNELDEYELMKHVESKNMTFISTPFSRAAANRLESWDVPAYKIGSGECNNYPLLEHIASFGKPIILSTGMNTIESINKAVSIFKKNNISFALLHTTNLYPTPNNLVRLGAMKEMSDSFPNIVYGLSDHTISNHACFGAVALGASILERHFTDKMDRIGPDIICSMDEGSCNDLITGSEIIWTQSGGKKGPSKEEQVTIDFAFATICSIQKIKEGEELTMENIWVKRPGTGDILAEKFNVVLGKKATREIEEDEQLKWIDFE